MWWEEWRKYQQMSVVVLSGRMPLQHNGASAYVFVTKGYTLSGRASRTKKYLFQQKFKSSSESRNWRGRCYPKYNKLVTPPSHSSITSFQASQDTKISDLSAMIW